MALLSSHLFSGTERYEVLRKLGEGAMGAVYAARDVEREETVALKVLTHSDPRALLRFKTEYRSLQDMEHPNLVRLGELVESEGHWFFSMELIDGVDLIEYVRGSAPPPGFDEQRLRACFQQLALAVDVLHSVHKLHRDIKPSNVLVAHDGRVVLLDFGLVANSTAEDRSTGGHVLGTAAYMSPEQAASRPLTSASDWYGFGTVLYHALAGELPFGGSLIELLMAKQSADPPPPSAVVPSVPPDLDQLCADLLRFDPEQRPSGKEILRRLGFAGVPSHGPTSWTTLTDSHVFVGRGQELDRLRAVVADATGGVPAPIYVHGRSGMGKTCLVNRFLDERRVADEETLVLRGRCYEHESVPFKAVDGVIDSLSRALTHLPERVLADVLPRDAALLPKLFPVLGRVEAIARMERPRPGPADLNEVRQVTFRTLRELLCRLVRHRRVIVSVDDFQWTDGDSIALLRAVFGGQERPGVGLVLSSREPTPPELFHSDRSQRGVEWECVEVGRLGLDDSAELARRLLASADPRVRVDCVALAQEAQGHPLFISELVRYVTTADGEKDLALELDEAICKRVRVLPAPARSVVELLAVASGPLTVPTVELATGLSGDELARTLALLRVVALVRTGRERPFRRVQPYHDRVREAVGGQLSEEAAAGHHLRLATALEADAGAAPEAVAYHARAAGLVDKAAEFYTRAGDRAVAGLAFDQAVSFYRQVLASKQSAAATLSLRVRIAEALAHAGRGVEAAAEYSAAADGANAAERVRLRNLGAIHLLRSGHVDEGLDALGEVLRSVNLKIPRSRSSAIPALLLERVRLGLRGYRCKLRDASEIAPQDIIRVDALAGVAESLGWVDGVRAAGIGSRWLRSALAVGECSQVVRALCFEAVYSSLVGGVRRRDKTAGILRRARDIAQAVDRTDMELYIATSEALVAQHECRFADVYQLSQQVLLDYESHPDRLPWELATVRLVWLFGLLMTGRFAEFVDTAEVMLRDADERHDRWFSSILRVLMAPWAALTRYDDPAKARALLDEGIESWRDREFGLIHYNWLNSAVWVETYNGNGEAGVELLRRHRRDLARSGSMRVPFLRIVMNGTAAAAHLARFDQTKDARALSPVRRIIRSLSRERDSFSHGSARTLAAAIAVRIGNLEAAIEGLADGSRLHREAGLRGFATGIDWHRGHLIGGDPGTALVRDAEAFFQRERVANVASFARGLGLPAQPHS